METARDAGEANPSIAVTITAVAVLRLLDLVAIAAGGQRLSGRACPAGCLQEGIANWDGHWYSSIAASGYEYIPGTDSNVAFFPGFPLSMRAVAPLFGGNYLWAGLAISLAVSALALVVVAKLVGEDFSPAAGRRAALLLAGAPAAFFFALPYADGLLLALATLSILAARRGRWWVAALAAAAAGTVRVTGALLLIPLVWEFLEQRGWRFRRVVERRSAGSLAWLALAPAGILAWSGWLWYRFGEPLAFARAQFDGWPHRLTWLFEPVRYTVAQLLQPRGYLTGARADLYWAYLLDIGTIVMVGALAFAVRRRGLPGSYWVWWGVAFLLPLMSGTTNSTARYILVAFPVFAAAALVLKTRAAFWPVVGAGAGLQLVLARAFGMGWWVG